MYGKTRRDRTQRLSATATAMELEEFVPTTVEEHLCQEEDLYGDDMVKEESHGEPSRTSSTLSCESQQPYYDEMMDLQFVLQQCGVEYPAQMFSQVPVDMKVKEEMTPTVLDSNTCQTDEISSKEEILKLPVDSLSSDQRKTRRKEQNRLAAARCRQKKRQAAENILVELREEEKRNKLLKERIIICEKEKSELLGLIKTHFKSCSTVPYKKHGNQHGVMTPQGYGNAAVA